MENRKEDWAVLSGQVIGTQTESTAHFQSKRDSGGKPKSLSRGMPSFAKAMEGILRGWLAIRSSEILRSTSRRAAKDGAEGGGESPRSFEPPLH